MLSLAYVYKVKYTLTFKQDLYSRLALLHEPLLIAHAPSHTDEAFILDAFAVEIFFEMTGGAEE